MDDLINLFLGSLYGLSPLTMQAYKDKLLLGKNCFSNFILLNPKAVEEISPEDIEAYKTSLFDGGLSISTIRNHLSVLRKFFKHVRQAGYIKHNPAMDVDLPQPSLEQKLLKSYTVITPDVCETLFTENFGYNDFTRSRNKMIICLMLRRGLSPCQVASVLIDDICGDGVGIRVSNRRGKKKLLELDLFTKNVLSYYLKVRDDYLHYRHAKLEQHLICNSSPREGSYELTAQGISAIIERIAKELNIVQKMDTSGITPTAMMHTARFYDWVVEDTISIEGKHEVHFQGASSFLTRGKLSEHYPMPIFRDCAAGI
jgi:site-specific recombinase XerD